mgnify:FL=1|jgi:hypothetical protein
MTLVSCPYCGNKYKAQIAHRHIGVCIKRPDMCDLVRSIMDADGSGVGCALRDYQQRAIAHNARQGYGLRAPSTQALRNAFGVWANVLAWLDLAAPARATQTAAQRDEREAVAIAEVAAALEADAELRESLRTRGLPVVRVRELPDGRVACELR